MVAPRAASRFFAVSSRCQVVEFAFLVFEACARSAQVRHTGATPTLSSYVVEDSMLGGEVPRGGRHDRLLIHQNLP